MPAMPFASRVAQPLWVFLIACLAIPSSAQQPSPVAASCRQFAQDFYTWYIPIVHKQLKVPASEIALKKKPTAFSAELLRALKEDSEAQAKVSDDIVGLDFDPFIGGQDPSDHYELRNASLKGDRCTVEIWSASRGHNSPKPTKPDATAELSRQTGSWQFVNFHYADDPSDLLTTLATLAKDRSKH